MSELYDSYKQSLLDGDGFVDFDADTIKVALVNVATDYTFSAAHDFLDDVTVYSGTTPQTVTNVTVTDGKFDHDPVTFADVAADGAKTVAALVYYKDTGDPGTSPLVAYVDGFTPILPNGGDITHTPHAVDGVFAF